MQRRYKRQLEQTWGELVYEAQWYSPLKKSMDAFIEHTQEYVSGDIRMVLHGGRATVNGRRSESSLYDFNLATYETGVHSISRPRAALSTSTACSRSSQRPVMWRFRREHGLLNAWLRAFSQRMSQLGFKRRERREGRSRLAYCFVYDL